MTAAPTAGFANPDDDDGVEWLTIQTAPGGDGAAVAAALAAASGDWVTVLCAGEALLPGAIGRFAAALDAAAGTDLAYADARVGAVDGPRLCRPRWSPRRLLAEDWLGAPWFLPAPAARRAAAEAAAGGPAWRLALLLGATRHVQAPLHLPTPLAAVPAAVATADADGAATQQVVRRYLQATGAPAEVTAGEGRTRLIRHQIRGAPLVSIVIPTRFSGGVVDGRHRTFVLSLLADLAARTSYQDFEVVLVVDDGVDGALLEQATALLPGRVRLVAWPHAFSFSGKTNLGVACAGGELVLLCNDDVEVADPRWLEAMVGLVQQPGVGMVGALLHFEDGTIQHAGHLYRSPRNIGHVGLGATAADVAADPSLVAERECAGVTAACALLHRSTYLAVGGCSPELAVGYNDVDLSLKLRAAGLRVVCTPAARLRHFETRTRTPGVAPFEQATVQRRWARDMQPDDPYWPASTRRVPEPPWPPLSPHTTARSCP